MKLLLDASDRFLFLFLLHYISEASEASFIPLELYPLGSRRLEGWNTKDREEKDCPALNVLFPTKDTVSTVSNEPDGLT